MFGKVIVKCKVSKNPTNKIYYGFIETKECGQMFIGYFLDNDILHICYLHFASGKTLDYFTKDLQKLWPMAHCEENGKLTIEVFNKYLKKDQQEREICVNLNGTEFQMHVWSTLLAIPYGEERTYGEVAKMMDCSKAVRAVANAVGNNNIAVLIPCHRVKAKNGDKLKYKWGSELKKKILFTENIAK